VGDR